MSGSEKTLRAEPSYDPYMEEGMMPRNHTRKRGPYLKNNTVKLIIGFFTLSVIFYLFYRPASKPPAVQTLSFGDRPIIISSSMEIAPRQQEGFDKEGIKKAPGDKQADSLGQADLGQATDKIPVYLYTGTHIPNVVVVTVLDDTRYPKDYCNKIVENRVDYARKHGYGLYIRRVSEYENIYKPSHRSSTTWARLAVAREATAAFQKVGHFLHIDSSAIIMNMSYNAVQELVTPSRLEKKMLRKTELVRGQVYVNSFEFNPAKSVELIMSRAEKGITTSCFFYANTLLNHAWLESLMISTYRLSQKFSDADEALVHYKQWHTHYLNHFALVEPKYLASYDVSPQADLEKELLYQPGNFIVMVDCDYSSEPCKKRFQAHWATRDKVAKNKG